MHAPALLDVEVAQVVRRYTARGDIPPMVGERALRTLGELDLERHTHELVLPLIWRLRNNLTAYDAAFVALAAILDAPLVTLDARLAAAPLPLCYVAASRSKWWAGEGSCTDGSAKGVNHRRQAPQLGSGPP